jgi:hypothetical protein
VADVFKVTYPAGGEILRKGTTYEIKWEIVAAPPVPNARIRLKKTGVVVYEIVTQANPIGAYDRSYFWKVPEDLTVGADYAILIKCVGAPDVDETDKFSIEERLKIEDFVNLTDFEKVVIVELRAGIEMPDEGWSLSGSTYSIAYTGPEIVDLLYNGVKLTRVRSQSDCNSLDNSYYHDYENQILYVNLYAVSPEDSGVFLVGYTWLCFCNSQHNDYMIDYTPQNSWYPVFYKPFLDVSNIPNISQSVQEYYTQAVTTQFGSLKFNNDGWWWTNKENYLWHNCEVWVKLGELDCLYDEFVTIFPGRTRTPSFSDKGITISVKDKRVGILKEIPVDRYDTTTYPNLEESMENRPVPILFGIKNGFIPPCINTTTFVYQLSQTVFDSTTYALQSVDNVYLDDVEIFETVDYTKNLNAGTITLVNDPGDGTITVNAHGIKCQYDFSDGSTTSTFSENVADILFFILTELNDIEIEDIDLDSFDALQTQRTQRLGWYLSKATKTLEFVRTLQLSALFHFIPALDGRFIVRYYDRDTPSDALRFKNQHYFDFSLLEDTESCFQSVVLQYDRDPTKDEWKVLKKTWAETGYKYSEFSTLTISTALVDATEALNLMNFYVAIVKFPGDKLVAGLSPKSLELIPGDKAYFSRSIVDGHGDTVTILDDAVYLFLSVVKNINQAKTKIIALEDSQAKGQAGHADIPHADDYTDEHTDTHIDSAHTDVAHTDTHTDVPHVDDYTDYTDEVHQDETYSDHGDDAHIDTHNDHTDGFHNNSYIEVPYVDHDDNPHSNDYTDDNYSDHDNTAYQDAHGDIAHGDGYNDSYSDEHIDIHGDIPHTDSET